MAATRYGASRRLRDLLSRYLQRQGYRVTTAKNAGDARVKLDGLTFDLLILDVMMPGETGFELAKSVRKTSQVPILMLTARAETDGEAFRSAGIVVAGRQHSQEGAADADPAS